MSIPPRRKKRVHPPRRIVPRANLGVQWIVGSILLAVVILVVGAVFLFSNR